MKKTIMYDVNGEKVKKEIEKALENRYFLSIINLFGQISGICYYVCKNLQGVDYVFLIQIKGRDTA